MLLFFKRLLLVATAALLLGQKASGFALLGPRDTWQVSTIGYDPQADGGDLGGPKNLTEEWRWPIPEITYGFDPTFITFFGTNGINAVNAAFALYNREMTDLKGLSFQALKAKPRETRRIHSTAQALGLLDVKTETMGLIAEQLGLASAERFTWTLRSRNIPGVNFTNYVVIQRNFDPFTYTPTPYVNGTRYSYQIRQFPARFFAVDFESTSVFPVDQSKGERAVTVSALTGEDFTSVPDLQIKSGIYYSALTQDDIGGLKYIYSRDNVNTEDVIAGTTNRIVDLRSLTYLQGIDAFNFFASAVTNSASNILAQFPALAFAFSTNVVAVASNIVTTNVFVTNTISPGLFTNYAALTVISNRDLFGFSEASRTNTGGALIGQFPGLVITSTNSTPVAERGEVYYLTNYPWAPAGSFPSVATNIVTNIVANFQYTYANVITNYKSALTDLEIQTISFTGSSFITNIAKIKGTNKVSGGFYILTNTPNLFGYSFIDTKGNPLLRVTNLVRVTNVLANVPLAGFTKLGINTFTNVNYAAYPVLLNAVTSSGFITNFSVTPVVRYLYSVTNFTAGDIFTGQSHFVLIPSDTNILNRIDLVANGNSNVVIQTIDQTNPANPKNTTSVIPSPFPLGVVLIYDPTQFVLAGAPIITSGLATNIITTFTDPITGGSFTQLLIYQTNSALFPAHPIVLTSAAGNLQRAGVNSIKFKQIPFTDFLNQTAATSTNYYNTVTFDALGRITTNSFVRVAGPDILIQAGDLGVDTGGFPVQVRRSITWQSGTTIIQGGGFFNSGPGLVIPQATFSFSTITPYQFNQSPNFTDEQNSNSFFGWGSFDSHTITPRVYPEDLNTQVTLELMEALALTGRTP